MPWLWRSNDNDILTSLEHNRYVGLSHIGYASLHLLSLVAYMTFFGFMLSNIYATASSMGSEAPPPAFFAGILIFAGSVNFIFTIPSIVAAYAFLKRRPWAKIAGIVGGVTAAMSFPLGTAVAVYTFWFLFSDTGKALYDRQPPLPPSPPSEWVTGER